MTAHDNHTGPWISSLAKEKSEEINDRDEAGERIAVGRIFNLEEFWRCADGGRPLAGEWEA